MIYKLAILGAILFVIIIIHLVRKNRLHEKYSIFWLFFSFVILIFSIFPQLTEFLAKQFGVYYAPSLIFLFGIVFVIFYLVHLSIVITKQNKRVVRLTQEVALLKGSGSYEKKD